MVTEWFNTWHQWLFEQVVQPSLYWFGWMSFDEMAYDWTHLFLLGALELVVLKAKKFLAKTMAKDQMEKLLTAAAGILKSP